MRLVKQYLFRGVVHMIISPYHRVDPHCDIINHHGKIISGGAVAPLNDKIVQFRILKKTILPFITSSSTVRPMSGAFKTHNGVLAFGKPSLPACAVISGFSPRFHCLFPHLIHLFRRTGTIISMSRIQKLLYIFFINIKSPGLKIRAVIPVNAEPFKGVKYGINRFLGGTLNICVFNSEDKFPFCMTCIQPVKKGCSCSPT